MSFPMSSNYRRSNRQYYNDGRPTSVSIYWSRQYDAYALKWMDTKHFKEMQPFIAYFKSKPYGDCVYDPDGKIWYFKEQYLTSIRSMLDAFGPAIFEVNFVEKPVERHLIGTKTISIDAYLMKFHELTGENLKDLDYPAAKKRYRLACLKLHPDHNPNVDPTIMSSVNEIWSELESKHFKVKQEIQYESPKEPINVT